MKTICVFCGSSSAVSPQFYSAADAMAREILKRDLTLVYGGATVGLMGQIAREVMAGGGRVIGVIPGFLASREIAHNG
ncbi:MAG TPA: TIGR00730 family Rossman fold protein, partial [Leptospiraceae bacterium]|nr:TIGR00730 family Rossman fold protein [Leptospiraceae bacterium]